MSDLKIGNWLPGVPSGRSICLRCGKRDDECTCLKLVTIKNWEVTSRVPHPTSADENGQEYYDDNAAVFFYLSIDLSDGSHHDIPISIYQVEQLSGREYVSGLVCPIINGHIKPLGYYVEGGEW